MRRLFFAAFAITWSACSASPAGNCGEGARLVGDICRPVCNDDSECLGSEVCTDSVCVPGTPTPNADASVAVRDDAAEAKHDDAATMGGDPDASDTAMDAAPMPNDDAGVIVVHTDAEPMPMGDGGPRRQADLTVVRGPGMLPAPVLVGEDFAFSATVNNIGDAMSAASQLALFLNPDGDTTYSMASIPVGNVAVPGTMAGASRTLSITARVPNSVPPGRRQLLLVVDPLGTVVERNELNNVDDLGRVDITTITVEPRQLAFGQISSPCGESILPLSLVNRGTTPVSVAQIQLAAGSAFTVELPSTPLMLQGGQRQPLAVTFHPRAVGMASASIQIDHDQAGSPITVPLSGEGVAGSQTLTFAPPHQRRADILFVIDDVSRYESELALRAPAIIADLTQTGADYHLAVTGARTFVGSNPGDLRGPPYIITPQTPNPAQALASNLSANVGIPTGNNGLRAIERAMTNQSANAAGFVREPAWFLALILNDADDNDAGSQPATIADEMRTLKNGSGVSVAAGFLNLGGCSMPIPSTKYDQLVTLTGGTSASVCDPMSWATVFDALRGTRFGMPYTFSLAPRAPSVATLSVNVAGVQLPADAWEYDSMNNVVRILDPEETPAAGDSVEISFVPVCN